MSTLTKADTDTFEFLAGFDIHRHLGGQPTPYHRRDECREIREVDSTEHFLFTLVTVDGLGFFSRVIDIASTKQLVVNHRDLFFHLRNLADEIPIHNGWPQVLVAIVLTPTTKLNDLKKMFECPVPKFRPFALKIFPGFRSPHGIDDYDDPGFCAIMEYAQEQGIPVMSHVESPDGATAATNKFAGLVKRYSDGKFVSAHVTNQDDYETIRSLYGGGYKVLGAVNPQHAFHTEVDYLKNGRIINPNLFMNPPFGSKTDAFWARQAMLVAEPCFALGSDSVAKTIESKQAENPSAGIYWSPEVLYSVLISAFEQAGEILEPWPVTFNRFIRQNAERFFGLDPVWQDCHLIRWIRQPWTVPIHLPCYGNLGRYEKKRVVPIRAGETLPWMINRTQ